MDKIERFILKAGETAGPVMTLVAMAMFIVG